MYELLQCSSLPKFWKHFPPSQLVQCQIREPSNIVSCTSRIFCNTSEKFLSVSEKFLWVRLCRILYCHQFSLPLCLSHLVLSSYLFPFLRSFQFTPSLYYSTISTTSSSSTKMSTASTMDASRGVPSFLLGISDTPKCAKKVHQCIQTTKHFLQWVAAASFASVLAFMEVLEELFEKRSSASSSGLMFCLSLIFVVKEIRMKKNWNDVQSGS